MSRPVSTGCRCVVDGQEITPEWLVENKGLRHTTATHRIYEFNRGLIPVETLMTWGKAHRNKGVAKASDEWKRLNDKPKKCSEFQAGSWEKKHIKDREPVTERRGRPRWKPDPRHVPAFNPGQFGCPYTNLFR